LPFAERMTALTFGSLLACVKRLAVWFIRLHELAEKFGNKEEEAYSELKALRESGRLISIMSIVD